MTERIIDNELRLIPYYRNDEASLPWYQDLDVCRQVDNREKPYDVELLHRMYDYLTAHGDCYYIEYKGVLVGDVSLRENSEIAVVVCKEYQNQHIGRRCVLEMLKLAREKGMERVKANIYSFNGQSQRMFQSVGFEKTAEEMNIKYNQLCIRNAEKKDCEQLAVWWNDGTVMAHAGFPNGLGTSAAEIEKQIADDSDETRRRLIIEYNDVRIGEMSFYVFENHRYEIGIKICESDYQEKGIGRVVLSMLIEELFRMGANVIFLDTNLKNTRAQHVYEKLGFRKTAVHYNSWKNQLGEMESSVDYELTADEFCNLK